MTSLPITSSNLPSSARNASLPGSDPSAVNPSSTIQLNGIPDVQSAEPFGVLLAQQMDEARTSAFIAPFSEITTDTGTTADPANLTCKDDHDKTLVATGITNDPSSVLAAMLQLPREIRTPVIKDATGNTAYTMATSKAANHLPAAVSDAAQARATSDMAIDGNRVMRGTSALEMPHPAALTDNLPGTPLPEQNPDPLIVSIAASSVMPDMPGNNRPVDTRQTIATPLGSPSWAGEFSQKINWMSTQQNHVAELHLNPPDLGPLDVVLEISDNQATALFTSPHGAVREAVENALPKLREILADNGITLGNTTVSDQPPRGRDAERFIGQGSGTAAQRDNSSEASGMQDSLAAASPIASARRHNGMVDTFA